MATRTCHHKGCNKLPTFNKTRKTSGKFCAEHKKDGMVSIMYRHCNNQVDKIFKMLPRELQWEILTDFVGGFAVRFNRLRRLLSDDIQEKIVDHNFGLNWLLELILAILSFPILSTFRRYKLRLTLNFSRFNINMTVSTILDVC